MGDLIRLHIWGEALGLPSIDPECIATTAYLIHASNTTPNQEWSIISDFDTSSSPNGDFPYLEASSSKIAGFRAIVKELDSLGLSLAPKLDEGERSELFAWTSFIQQRGQELLDLYFYASYYNYWDQISPAFTKMLPWYANYIVPPARRAAAVSRTKHLGIRSLDIDNLDDIPTDNEGRISGKPSMMSTGLNPAQSTPQQILDQQRMQKWLKVQKHSDTFQLYQLSEAFFGPLERLLGQKDYLLSADQPSSLDFLALGYLSLMLFAPVTYPWLSDALKQRYPKLQRYTARMYRQTFKNSNTPWEAKTTSAPAPSAFEGIKFVSQRMSEWVIPMKPTVNPDSAYRAVNPSDSQASSLSLSTPIQAVVLSASILAGIVFAASKYIDILPDNDGVFTSEERRRAPIKLTDMGEAGAALAAAFGERRELDASVERERERVGGATIVEVDVEGQDGNVGRDVYVSK